MTVEQVEFSSVWVKKEFTYAEYDHLLDEETGLGDITVSAPTVTPIFGRNSDGVFVELATIEEAPGEGDTFQIDFYGQYDQIHTLEQFLIEKAAFYVQSLSYSQPPTDIRSLATKLEHYRVKPTGGTRGAGRNLDGSGGLRTNNITMTASNRVVLNLQTSLSSITNTATEAALSIAMLTRDLKDRDTGYPGPDQLIYIGLDDDTIAPGDIIYSSDAGGTWQAIATDPSPFDEISGITSIVYNFISDTQYRLVVGRQNSAAVDAEFAYGDFTFGAPGVDPGWTQVTIAATANDDAIEAMLWPESSRLYIASAGDVYLSTDLGISDPGTAIFSGANAINQFFYDRERNVWAVGASNTILCELVNDRGVFVTKTGPSGGGAFTAIARANNGIIYAGNGTSVFRNTNEASTAGGWTSLRNFGTNWAVQNIFCVNGSSEVVYAVVDNSTSGDGALWFTTNGGTTWTQKTATTNGGYAEAALSTVNPNIMFITGAIEGSNPIIDKLS